MNTLKTGVLLVALTMILLYAGQAISGQQGMTIALKFAAIDGKMRFERSPANRSSNLSPEASAKREIRGTKKGALA